MGANQHSDFRFVEETLREFYMGEDDPDFAGAINALHRLEEQLEALHNALEYLLDFSERSRHGAPHSHEEWYVARDGARIALEASSPAKSPLDDATDEMWEVKGVSFQDTVRDVHDV